MLSTQWCFCTFLALFAALSISTIDAKSNHKGVQLHKGAQNHKAGANHHKGGRDHHKGANKYRTIYVDPSGRRGGFRSIQAAINSVPSNNKGWICIHVKKGVYRWSVYSTFFWWSYVCFGLYQLFLASSWILTGNKLVFRMINPSSTSKEMDRKEHKWCGMLMAPLIQVLPLVLELIIQSPRASVLL